MIPLSHLIRTTIIVTILLFISAFCVGYLWNNYLIECFNVQKIEYKHALALQVVCFLLFGRTSMFNTINMIEQTEGEIKEHKKTP
jgi:preprotein translocase subunit SecG